MFAVVAQEVAGCLNLPLVSVIRFDAGEMAVHVGAWGRENPFPVGNSRQLDEHGAAGLVFHSGRPAWVDYAHVPGPFAARLAHEAGIRTAVAVPKVGRRRRCRSSRRWPGGSAALITSVAVVAGGGGFRRFKWCGGRRGWQSARVHRLRLVGIGRAWACQHRELSSQLTDEPGWTVAYIAERTAVPRPGS